MGTSEPSEVVSDTTQPSATTCTPNPGDLWCGVVTVALHSVSGFDLAYGFVDSATDTGALSETGFSVGMNPYTIDSVSVGLDNQAGVLYFGLTSLLTAADKAKLVLHVGSASFAFSVAAGPDTEPGLPMGRHRPGLVVDELGHAAAAAGAGGPGPAHEPRGRGQREHADRPHLGGAGG